MALSNGNTVIIFGIAGRPNNFLIISGSIKPLFKGVCEGGGLLVVC
jgi:hypothetical protein